MITILDENSLLEDPGFFMDKLKKIQPFLKLKGEVTIKIGLEEEAVHLNKTYRRKDYIPDVLSFLLEENLPEGFYLGDIFICYPQAQRQASENKISLSRELLILMIHGLLHLSGYDHDQEDDSRMQDRQDELLAKVM